MLVEVKVPDIRITEPQIEPEKATSRGQSPAEAGKSEPSAVRRFLLSRGNSAVADLGFRVLRAEHLRNRGADCVAVGGEFATDLA